MSRSGCHWYPRLYWETEWLRLGLMLSHPFPWGVRLKESVLCTNAGGPIR